MKNKVLCLLFFLCMFIYIPVYAECLPDNYGECTEKRSYTNNYGVNKNIEMNATRISHALETPYVDTSLKIYDFSDILTDEEEKSLREKMITFQTKTNMDIVILTVNLPYAYDSTNEDYAADFYDYNDFGLNYSNYSGILLLRNTYENDPYFNIYTFGEAQLYFTYSRLENILDDIYPYFKNGSNYLKGMNKYIDSLSDYYDSGKPYSSKYDKLDENGIVIKGFYPSYFVYIVISSIIACIVTFIERGRHKMIKKSTQASDYLDKKTVNYTRKEDIFLRTHTTSHVISSSSSGGGSHVGSSGGGHSSGGGRHG